LFQDLSNYKEKIYKENT